VTLSPEYYASNRDLWVVLALAFTALLGLTLLTYRRCRRIWSLRHLGRAEAGAAYTITMVATMPIYAMLVAMIIECTLTLQVKIGTLYAAYAAARSAAVWYPAEVPRAVIERKVKTAAVQAIAPFASSRDDHLAGIGASAGDAPEANDLYEAYAAYCHGPITFACLDNKLRYAWQATTVSVEPSCSGPGADLTVTVRYQMPFHSAIGYCLGGRRSSGGLCLREIETTVTLPKEGVKSPTQTLGIHYDPDHD
jgi:hypothetical protein